LEIYLSNDVHIALYDCRTLVIILFKQGLENGELASEIPGNSYNLILRLQFLEV